MFWCHYCLQELCIKLELYPSLPKSAQTQVRSLGTDISILLWNTIWTCTVRLCHSHPWAMTSWLAEPGDKYKANLAPESRHFITSAHLPQYRKFIHNILNDSGYRQQGCSWLQGWRCERQGRGWVGNKMRGKWGGGNWDSRFDEMWAMTANKPHKD